MLRNREIRRFGFLCLLIIIVTVIPLCYLFPAAGVWVFLSDACLTALFFAFTAWRYRRIARISEQIDGVLHGEERLAIDGAEEGELSILQSEISKMVLRIREQNEALKGEKAHLADSLADIAHQLRTPLTSASLILTLAERETEAAERKRLLREAEALFSQVNHLLDSLLKLSRLDAGIVGFREEAVSVKELTASSLRPFLIPMELHGIHLVTEIPEGAEIIGDADWLTEALQNILKNCIQSIGDGGTIVIGCEDTLLYTEITIQDDGSGFSREELPHLFDRFYRGGKRNTGNQKSSGTGGYGIGLDLCRTIIKRQGGTVTAGNHPEGGAVFRIRFPK